VIAKERNVKRFTMVTPRGIGSFALRDFFIEAFD
jgi:hypothetical protein